ncbi:hypothetical protein [Tenacibaculum dicentrarchi]|uniref:hypothetical protein n=1 Tax=Tenacibaculum dicentrarchi TaxID=669041 RepID=UPI003515CC4E
MKNEIIKAIENRSTISFKYKGEKRIVEPFTLGTLKTTSNLTLSAFWVGGFSETKKVPHWRLYTLSKISELSVENNKASMNQEGYNPNDTRMELIICTV